MTKDHRREYMRKWRAVHPEYSFKRYRIKDIERMRKFRKEYPEKHREYGKTYRKTNQYRTKARLAVFRAIKSGKLVRKPCTLCGGKLSQAHHSDYSKPLKVIFLCRSHHRRLHEEIKVNKNRSHSSALRRLSEKDSALPTNPNTNKWMKTKKKW